MNQLGGKVWSKVGAFGVTDKRFHDEKEKAPGPGQYNTVKYKRKKQQQTSSIFKSKVT